MNYGIIIAIIFTGFIAYRLYLTMKGDKKQ